MLNTHRSERQLSLEATVDVLLIEPTSHNTSLMQQLQQDNRIRVLSQRLHRPEVRRMVSLYDFDVLVMQVDRMHDEVLEVLDHVRQWRPLAEMVMVLEFDDTDWTLKAVAKGVRGVIHGQQPHMSCSQLVHAVTQDGASFPPMLTRRLLAPWQHPAAAANGHINPLQESLTPREVQILRMISGGLTSAQMGRRLGISPWTVSTHVKRMLAKMQVHSRAQAISMAHDLGLFKG
jgi:DNA-binding NarL/FixJ family response regulator